MLDPLLKPNVRTVRDQAHFLYDVSDSDHRPESIVGSFDSDASFLSHGAPLGGIGETKQHNQPHHNQHSYSSNSSIQLSTSRRIVTSVSRHRTSNATQAAEERLHATSASLTCFRHFGFCIFVAFFFLAIAVGISGMINVNFEKGRRQRQHPYVPPPPNARGNVILTPMCERGTGWNISTDCQVCMSNWRDVHGGLCNDCADNHYGPNCHPCKCAVYDHSFGLPNEERFLNCDEGVHGDGTCSIVYEVYIFFVVFCSLLLLVVTVHLLLLCDVTARQCTHCTSRCPPIVGVCMNFTAGSVGKLPSRFRRFFVASTVLVSFSTFAVLYSVVGQQLYLSPRWMLIWSVAVFFINISNFSLLSLLVFEVGGELYAKQRENNKKKFYREKFLTQRDDVKRLQEGWLITDETINFLDEKPLGEGASATVWKAGWEPLSDSGGTVAVKVLDRSDGELNALNKEIELMQRLSHSRLVKFFGAGKLSTNSSFGTKGTMFLVTELLHGGDLGSLLSDPDAIQRWRWESRLKILIDIVQGMCYLHVHDVAHRDLKPANVLLDRKRERAKVADFGLAKLLLHKKRKRTKKTSAKRVAGVEKEEAAEEAAEEAPASKSAESAESALSGSDLETAGGVAAATGMLGSGPYMAPELWKGRQLSNVDPFKVDVYALAITMWQVMEAPQLPYVDQGWNPDFTYQLKHMVGEQEMRPIYDQTDALEKFRPIGYTKLMEEGWDQDARRRPTMKIMLESLEKMYHSLMSAKE